MCNKMPSPTMNCKSNEMKRGMRECDKFWKAKIEIQSTWEKIYILLYKPDDTSRMKFRYIEDYKKMKKINEMLYEIIKKMDYDIRKVSDDFLLDIIYE